MSSEITADNVLLDENFRCSCGGKLIPVEKFRGLYVYHCNTCWRGGQVECPVCHKPRTLWHKKYEVCMICAGTLNLTCEMLVEKARKDLSVRLIGQAKRMVESMYKNSLNKFFAN